MQKTEITTEGSATYCPEDNKLRLYVGRVPRDEYDRLRSEGWTATPKQNGDFVAVWTPERRDTALEFAGVIEDEDETPEDRAADRAERFAGYREKRTAEAIGGADRYDAGPGAHGYQSERRAARAAFRHDRIAGRACDAWGKAEYWQHRTAGVISHALHVATPAVRMGRIKEIEAEIRRIEKSRAEYADTFNNWTACAAMTDAAEQDKRALALSYVEHGDYIHPRSGRKSYLYDFVRADETRESDPLTGAETCALWLAAHGAPAPEGSWLTHYRLRLAYETQMLEAAGGRAAFVEMEVGGWIGGHQIRKVNKSSATGRVVSVTLKQQGSRYDSSKPGFCLIPYNVEKLPPGAYRAPSEADKAALADVKQAEKDAAPKKAPCPLVNPTDADAERLQDLWNAEALAEITDTYTRQQFKPSTVCRITQAVYSMNSGGSYARAETVEICAGGKRDSKFYSKRGNNGPRVCQVRMTHGNGNTSNARAVIILTDKPQKALPVAVWPAPVVFEQTAPVPVVVAVVAAVAVVGAQMALF